MLAAGEAEAGGSLASRSPTLTPLRSAPSRCASRGRLWGGSTSGGYGYTAAHSIAYAYLPAASAEPGMSVEVEIFGEWVGGEVAAEPLYDPSGERLRG